MYNSLQPPGSFWFLLRFLYSSLSLKNVIQDLVLFLLAPKLLAPFRYRQKSNTSSSAEGVFFL